MKVFLLSILNYLSKFSRVKVFLLSIFNYLPKLLEIFLLSMLLNIQWVSIINVRYFSVCSLLYIIFRWTKILNILRFNHIFQFSSFMELNLVLTCTDVSNCSAIDLLSNSEVVKANSLRSRRVLWTLSMKSMSLYSWDISKASSDWTPYVAKLRREWVTWPEVISPLKHWSQFRASM